MKKLTLLIALLFTAGLAFAQGRYMHGWGGGPPWQDKAVAEQMEKMHGLMHYGTVESQKIDKGIQIEVTSKDGEVVKTIKAELLEKQKELSAFFEGADVKTKDLKDGVQVTLTTDDKELVEDLQFYGNSLIYRYFRENIHNTAFKDRKFKKWGPGFGRGMGYGPNCPNR